MSHVERPADVGEWTPARVIHLARAADVDFVVELVNRLPDYEAAVDALERLTVAVESSETISAGYMFHGAPGIRLALPAARAALARLREKVPA